MRRFIRIAAVCLTVALSLAAGSGLQADEYPLGPRRPLPRSAVEYTIRANVVPESLLVRARFEVSCRNQTDSNLSEIRFDLGLPAIGPYDTTGPHPAVDGNLDSGANPSSETAYLRLDSVLFYGAPLLDSELVFGGNRMKAYLPTELTPGETGFFLMTYTARVPACPPSNGKPESARFIRWFPRVCARQDIRAASDDTLSNLESAGEPADFTVVLKMDSSWSLAHPGELFNDKEHYGLLPPPDNDSVYVDIVNRHRVEYDGRIYVPSFPSGFKEFYIRLRGAADFSFVVGKRLVRDRAYVDSLTVEACYPAEVGPLWAGFVVASAAELVRQYEKWLGRFPRPDLTITAGPCPDGDHTSPTLIVLPDCVVDSSMLYAMLAVHIADCWFSIPTTAETGPLSDRGLARFLATIALFEKYGLDGYRVLRVYDAQWPRGFSGL